MHCAIRIYWEIGDKGNFWIKSKLDQSAVVAVWLTLDKHMLTQPCCRRNLNTTLKVISHIKIFSALHVIRTLSAGGMYLASVDMNAVCLCCLYMIMCFIQVKYVYLGILHDLASVRWVSACLCGHGIHFVTIQSLPQMQHHDGALCCWILARLCAAFTGSNSA